MGSDVASRQPASAEGSLEVVASDGTVDVKDFPRKETMWNTLAFHCLRVDFVQRHAAGRNFSFAKPARAGNVDRAAGQRRTDLCLVSLGKLGQPSRRIDVSEFKQRSANRRGTNSASTELICRLPSRQISSRRRRKHSS